ncbi:unnamed protein product [Gongylonema pulchrum]|uniref:Arrestin_N domain-containing protein n=1 Tax=Gongylonema pulchrum TaxID=637853 RepID=A0A183EI51_9BILA|nr:unnamed protein product [Gongylonema pulchrum]
MVLIDDEYIKENRKITAYLLAAFRYGLEASNLRPLTRLQERLQKKLGANAYPFWFQIPAHSASSVTLQPAQGDTGKPCGVDFELKTVVGCLDGTSAEKPKKQ